jgi:hypothetical protein
MRNQKYVKVNSFHTSSLELLDDKPDAIVSFDSHLDISFGGGNRYLKQALSYPFPLRATLLRASIHGLLRRGLPDIPIYLVAPETCYLSRIHLDARDASAIEDTSISEQEIKDFTDKWIEEFLKIKLFLSPPRNLKHLSQTVRKHTAVFDIDIDYMQEFQDVCYTRAPRIVLDDVDVTKLGSLNDIIKAVRLLHPDIIIVSEIKRCEIAKPESPFSKMMSFFRNLGYDIELGELVDNDTTALKALEIAENFDKTLPHVRKDSMNSLKQFEYLDTQMTKALRAYVQKHRLEEQG